MVVAVVMVVSEQPRTLAPLTGVLPLRLSSGQQSVSLSDAGRCGEIKPAPKASMKLCACDTLHIPPPTMQGGQGLS